MSVVRCCTGWDNGCTKEVSNHDTNKCRRAQFLGWHLDKYNCVVQMDSTVTPKSASFHAAATADAAIDKLVEGFLRPAISDLPMVFPLQEQSTYYVRDCYEDYYLLYEKKLAGSKELYMMLTGTPGIGKSVFYMYFFDRYKQEHPDENIVLASFASPIPETCTGPELLSCRMWKAESKQFEVLDAIPKDPRVCTLHLYDGIPERYLSHDLGIKMICFASPNEAWIDRMIKFRSLFSVAYMPNWTFSEQQDARDALRLEISDEELRKRWDYFGGTVRYTLITNKKDIDKATRAVVSAIGELENVDRVQRCLRGRDKTAKVRHRLFHFDVTKNNLEAADVPMKVATRFIAAEVYSRLETKLDSDREKLIRWLEGAGKSGTFVGWLFEALAHEKLLDGATFDARNILTGKVTPLQVRKTVGNYTRFKAGIPMEQLFEDVYRIPMDADLRSIDGYYIGGNGVLWLVQITRNVNHEVNSLGIIKLLKDLGVLDSFVEGASKVNLLFIIPLELVKKFPEQTFWSPSAFKANLSDADVLQMHCDAIPNIKTSKKRKLHEIGIRTVEDVFRAKASNPQILSFVKSAVTEFSKQFELRGHLIAVEAIEQYAAPIPIDSGLSSLLAALPPE